MYCHKCGALIPDDASFCTNCGTKVKDATDSKSSVVQAEPTPSSNNPSSAVAEDKSETIIKCGNCGYVGPGEPARSMGAKILAWICVFFAPLITILYFVATHKYRCPKCHSTFLGIKNKKGEFTKGQSGANRIIWIIVTVLVGIAIIGILSAVVLAALNTARSKGHDAAIESDLSTIQTAAEIYYGGMGNSSYGSTALDCMSGMFAEDSVIVKAIGDINSISGSVTCNGSGTAYAVQAQLVTDNTQYWCVDSTGNSRQESESMIAGVTSCQ